MFKHTIQQSVEIEQAFRSGFVPILRHHRRKQRYIAKSVKQHFMPQLPETGAMAVENGCISVITA
jgi:hypothetical protein